MAGQEFTPRNRQTLYSRAVRTTHPDAATINIQRSDTVVVHISMEAITGTSITFTITAMDPVTDRVSGTLLASAAITAAGYTTLTIGPGVATVANASLQAIAPRKLRIVPTGTFTSAEYSVLAELVH